MSGYRRFGCVGEVGGVGRGLGVRVRRLGGSVLVWAVVWVVASWLALLVTPAQSVSAVGQTWRVSAVGPRRGAGFSGPGELDLFGQSIATRMSFRGLMRPRLGLARITIDGQLAQFVQASGRRGVGDGLSAGLVGGWRRYFVWQSVVAFGFAVVLLLAWAGVRHYPRRRMLRLVAGGSVVAVVANVGAVLVFAASASGALRGVGSLDDLVGASAGGAPPSPVGRVLPGVRAVVLGDSTAAGVGNGVLAGGGVLDSACGRSGDSYAVDLAGVNGWDVLNLACSGATVVDGVLGVQVVGSQVAPPQFGVLEQATHASVVALSVGANDVQWHAVAALCARAQTCDDQASTAYFQGNLAAFTRGYYQLLRDLAGLPQHPRVLVNEYFVPFGSDLGCVVAVGFSAVKTRVLLSRLAALNTVLAQGAQTFGFVPVVPRFGGHELCTAQPYVQGLADRAPLHPNAAGELAIALADQQALAQVQAPVSAAAGGVGFPVWWGWWRGAVDGFVCGRLPGCGVVACASGGGVGCGCGRGGVAGGG